MLSEYTHRAANSVEAVETREWLLRRLERVMKRGGRESRVRGARMFLAYFGLDGKGRHTYVSLGEEYGVCGQRVRQQVMQMQRHLRRTPITHFGDETLDAIRWVSARPPVEPRNVFS